MKHIQLFCMLVLSLSVTCSIAQDKKKGKEVTITGEIVDVKCQLNGMASEMGEDHKQCTIDCVKGGLPVAILEEKTRSLYVVVPKKGMKGANEELAKFAAQKVRLTGELLERGGLKMFAYTKVEEVK